MRPVILFGAFDRHNLGDMLFPHVLDALMPQRERLHAGLVAADLRAWGGHQVLPLDEALARLGNRAVDLIHVGGELLTCSAWQAAIMTLPAEKAREMLSRQDEGGAGLGWARGRLGCSRSAPYVVAAERLPRGSRTLFLGVGGEALDQVPAMLRHEVLHCLHQASFVGVRDWRTLEHLSGAFLPATLMPDTASLAAEVLSGPISGHALLGEPAAVRGHFPGGYLAVQFSADFCDDATLALMASRLERVAAARGLGIVFLRAGAAPWHDDLDGYRRLASRMAPGRCWVAETPDILELCALIQGGRAWCGSSLHGWILAASWGRPRAGLALADAGVGTKLRHYLETWEKGAVARLGEPAELAEVLEQAFQADPLPPATAPACRRVLDEVLAS
ncbi:MAG: polysaccharide pyruvyl transferase family protein [Rhodocyclaceae bacterium]|nr:polysaccharide pyruvyl transferase family protein [Rhodocyclaceae bacterium]